MSISVRFPEALRDRVREAADLDRRSMNAEILSLIEEALAAREANPGPKLLKERQAQYDPRTR